MEPSPRLPGLALAGQLGAALGVAANEGGFEAAWRRAWVLTAMGRYGEAWTALDVASAGPPPVAAAACVTRGSLLRQVGLPGQAEEADREALRRLDGRAGEGRTGCTISLVADAVARGACPAEQRARLQAAVEACAEAPSPRQAIRLAWVTGEVALHEGDPVHAATFFQQARRRAVDGGLRRHEARSLLLLASANAAVGHGARARDQAHEALAIADRCGARPLCWLAHRLLSEADGGPAPARAAAEAAALREGLLASLPGELATVAPGPSRGA